MRISVAHEALYRYDAPSTGVIQMLRLTPRNHTGQYVVDWRIEISADCRLEPQEDAFGNIVHAFSTDGPLSELRILAEGEIETQDTAGVVRGAVERFTPSLFLRETPLTRADEAIAAFAARTRNEAPNGEAGGDQTLAVLHRLLMRIDDEFVCDLAFENPETTAASAFAAKRGGCRDLAHVFIAVARTLGVPARFVSGYLCHEDAAGDAAGQRNATNTTSIGSAASRQSRENGGRGDHPDGDGAMVSEGEILLDDPKGAGTADGIARGPGHAWAEAHVPGLGWVGFDPANRVCVTDRYVRVAIGLDLLGAAPVRGAHFGGCHEAVAFRLLVSQAGWQTQG